MARSEVLLPSIQLFAESRDIWIEISVYNPLVISLTMEYALRASVFLAQRCGTSCTVHEIAVETQVPTDYLSKVMRDLCRANLVKSRPGRHGGYVLDANPNDITLLEVVEAVEPTKSRDKCPLKKPCHSHQLCPLHRAVRVATEAFFDSLKGCTLGALCRGNQKARGAVVVSPAGLQRGGSELS